MKNSKFKGILQPTLVLFIICLISAASLALTNNFTSNKVREMQQKKIQQAMAEVMPADNYEIAVDDSTAKFYKAIKDEKVAGYVAFCSETGYGGEVQTLIAIDSKGAIAKVDVISCDDETPGLGQKIKSDEFTNQFKGISKSVDFGDSVDAISGATISSTAVKNAVNTALELYDKNK